MISSTGIFYFGVREILKMNYGTTAKLDSEKLPMNAKCGDDRNVNVDYGTSMKQSSLRAIFILTGSLCLSIYVMQENTIMSFMTAFGVKSKLALTRQESTVLQAVYVGTFATCRIISTFAAVKVSTMIILVSNIVLSMIANVILLIMKDSSLIAVQVGRNGCLIKAN